MSFKEKLISYSKEGYDKYKSSSIQSITAIYAIKQRSKVYQIPGKFT